MFTSYEIHLILTALATAAHNSRKNGAIMKADQFWELRQKIADRRDFEEAAADERGMNEEVALKLFLTTRPMV